MLAQRMRETRGRLSLRQCMVLLGISAIAFVVAAHPTVAQPPASSLEFSIPKSVVITEAGEAPFNIKLKSGSKVTKETWFEAVTRPSAVSFSAGKLTDGVWRIPVADAASLRLIAPADTQGDGFIYVMLVDKGLIVAVATANLFISPMNGLKPAEAQPSLPTPAAPASDIPAAAAPKTTPKATEKPAPTNQAAASTVASVTSSDRPTAPQSASATPPTQTPPAAAAVVATPQPSPVPQKSKVPAPEPALAPAAPTTQVAALPAPAPVAAAPTPATKTPVVPSSAPAAPPVPSPAATPPPAAPTNAAPAATASAAIKTPPSPPATQPDQPVSARTPAAAATPQQQRLLAQGERNLADGNIAIARQYFGAAAELGSALAAFKLAETNDPYELQKAKVVGLKSDAAEALRWYRKAAEAGMAEATQRIERLKTPR